MIKFYIILLSLVVHAIYKCKALSFVVRVQKKQKKKNSLVIEFKQCFNFFRRKHIPKSNYLSKVNIL